MTDPYHQAAVAACREAAEKQGGDVVLLDLHEMTAAADYFLLVTCRSKPHGRGLAQAIETILDDFGLTRRGIEGYPDGPWILLDYDGVVAHIFEPEERDYYGLERLWAGARSEKFEAGMHEPMRNISP